jgi:hypothetical protein
MYGYNDGGPLERFAYANYEQHVFAASSGTWSVVPEPGVLMLFFVATGFGVLPGRRTLAKRTVE